MATTYVLPGGEAWFDSREWQKIGNGPKEYYVTADASVIYRWGADVVTPAAAELIGHFRQSGEDFVAVVLAGEALYIRGNRGKFRVVVTEGTL